jgi:hypothetical protein
VNERKKSITWDASRIIKGAVAIVCHTTTLRENTTSIQYDAHEMSNHGISSPDNGLTVDGSHPDRQGLILTRFYAEKTLKNDFCFSLKESL